MKGASVALCAGVLLAAPASAWADEGPGVAEGRAAFVFGNDLARRGQWVDALAAFERSRRLRRHPITTYNVAFSERALGHLSRARKLFRLALVENADGADGRLTDELEKSARTYVEELDRKVASVHVRLSSADLLVSVDGRPLEVEDPTSDPIVLVAGTAELGPPAAPPKMEFVLRIDPGPHTVELRAPGESETIVRRDVEDGAISAWVLERQTGLRPGTLVPVPVPPKLPPPGVRTTGLVSIGVGAAFTTAAIVTGVMYFAEKSALDDVCFDGECPSDRESRIFGANTLGTVTWVGAGVGLTGLAVGTALLLAFPNPGRTPLTPLVGPTGVGLAGRF